MRKVLSSILASLGALLLAGCFSSETPRIPVTRLSVPPDFAGTFWSISPSDSLTARRFEIRREGDGFAMTMEDNHIRLAELLGGKVYLLIADKQENRSDYNLLQRRQDGIWEVDQIGISAASPFAAQNLAYADTIARRHGLRLSDDSSETEIEGKIHGLGVPAFFADRDMLSALSIEPIGFYLPARPDPISVDEIDLPTRLRSGGTLDYAAPAPEGPAPGPCPADLAGTYSNPDYYKLDYASVILTPRGDCRFEMKATQGMSLLTLFPLHDDQGYYIAIKKPLADKPETIAEHGQVLVLRREDEGQWRFNALTLLPPSMTPEIDQLRNRAMQAAAQRHGVLYLDGVIDSSLAPMTVDRLKALFADGQFTSGLNLPENEDWVIVKRGAP